MIVSYETLRTLSVYLANCSIGLLLCDEGHRLKNSGEMEPFCGMRKLTVICRFSHIPGTERSERSKARNPYWYSYPGNLAASVC